MQCFFRCTIILFLFHEYIAQDKIDQMTDKNTKNAVEELLKKINAVSVQSFSNAPYGAKLELLQKVEVKLKKAARPLGKKGEKYVKIIMKGLKSSALNKVSDKNETQIKASQANLNDIPKLEEKYDMLNDDRTVETSTEFHGSKEKNKDESTKPLNINFERINKSDNKDIKSHFVLKEHVRRRVDRVSSDEIHSNQNGATITTSTEHLIQYITPHYECEGSLNKICLNIKQMTQLKCHFDDSFISIEKLCDGAVDCIDRTDEKFCTSQVTERIQNANQVIYQIDESFQLGCLPNRTKDSIMSTQTIILRSVLQSQQEFVEKYKYFNRSLLLNGVSHKGEATVKRAVNEISLIISSLALALDAELCSQQVTNDQFIARKFNDLLIEDFDKVMEEVKWPPKACVCKGERCENVTTCTDTCKRFCWQKHSLTQWGCPSINETENVPLSVICDGKFDCFDQSDEKDCVTGISYARYEAHNIFKEILSTLSTKVTSKEYAFIRNMLLSLHSTVEDLQKFCMEPEPDLKIIRSLRKKCFSALSSIYSETLTKSSFLYQKSEVFLFLMSLKENIVSALKRSHTGNKRIISNDRCFCRDGQCSMPICSRNCQRSCIAEPWLTRYYCENTANKSVFLENICDGKPNCPNKDDETHCEKEICRRHHLAVLRHSLQKIGKKQQGTSMGELLTTWKIKASSILLVAENDYRPNPHIIRDVVRDILNDLVITYGAVNDYRRDNEYALEEFTNIARYIMTFLRSCNH